MGGCELIYSVVHFHMVPSSQERVLTEHETMIVCHFGSRKTLWTDENRSATTSLRYRWQCGGLLRRLLLHGLHRVWIVGSDRNGLVDFNLKDLDIAVDLITVRLLHHRGRLPPHLSCHGRETRRMTAQFSYVSVHC